MYTVVRPVGFEPTTSSGKSRVCKDRYTSSALSSKFC